MSLIGEMVRMTDKEKLLAFLAQYGVTYVALPGGYDQYAARLSAWEEWKAQGLKEAPFAAFLGIVPATRIIVGGERIPWSNILHEAGHLLTQEVPLAPKSEEITWFGWEWAVVQYLDLSPREFLYENRDYGINWNGPAGYREDVGFLKGEKEIALFFQERLQEAQGLGVVALDGTPLVHPAHAPTI